MLDLLIALVPLTLATWRLWRIIAVDSITEPIRARFLFRDGPLWEWVADLVTCPWCLGYWLSGATTGVYVWRSGVFGPEHLIVGWVLAWLAVSAGVGITNVIVDNLSSND